jgi:U2 small nuclear ribonucleoprotein B''
MLLLLANKSSSDVCVQQISFARTRSDAVVKRLDAEHYEEHRQRRLQHKSVYLCICRPIIHADSNSPLYYLEATRYTNPLKRKFRAQRLAAESGHQLLFVISLVLIAIFFFFETIADGPAVSAPRRPAVQMPDEYLPPNKILFLQNLPESVSKDQLMALFSQ